MCGPKVPPQEVTSPPESTGANGPWVSARHGEAHGALAAGEAKAGEIDAVRHARARSRRSVPRHRGAADADASLEGHGDPPALCVEHLELRRQLERRVDPEA